MRYIVWFIRIVLFLLLFAFTLKNTTPVALNGLLDRQWEAPLIVFLLAFFVGGVIMGALAMVPTLVRLRRDVAELKRLQKKAPDVPAAIMPDPAEPAAPLDAVV